MENLQERITKKVAQIEKLERSYEKYASEDLEEKSIIDRFLETGDANEYKAYLRAHNRSWGGDAWSKAHELYDARNTLAKYQTMLKAESDRNATIAAIPETIKKFGENLENKWNEYDIWKKQTIREELKSEPEYRNRDAYKEFQRNMTEKWGRGWYEFAYYTTEEQIKKDNHKAVEQLILNLINRTVELVGTITDSKYLRLDRDNNGYAIINGIVIGTDGTVRIESIGAGGYNIQRYHIRVLVKPVRK